MIIIVINNDQLCDQLWSIVINYDQLWSIMIKIMINYDQLRSIMINYDQLGSIMWFSINNTTKFQRFSDYCWYWSRYMKQEDKVWSKLWSNFMRMVLQRCSAGWPSKTTRISVVNFKPAWNRLRSYPWSIAECLSLCTRVWPSSRVLLKLCVKKWQCTESFSSTWQITVPCYNCLLSLFFSAEKIQHVVGFGQSHLPPATQLSSVQFGFPPNQGPRWREPCPVAGRTMAGLHYPASHWSVHKVLGIRIHLQSGV